MNKIVMARLVLRLPGRSFPADSRTYKNPVILGLVPRIHAAPREPADVFAVLAVPSGGLFSHDGVDGRVKPDHDDLVSEAAP
jgi:hypothetical protein